jgi:hypothetical protein
MEQLITQGPYTIAIDYAQPNTQDITCIMVFCGQDCIEEVQLAGDLHPWSLQAEVEKIKAKYRVEKASVEQLQAQLLRLRKIYRSMPDVTLQEHRQLEKMRKMIVKKKDEITAAIRGRFV